MVYGYARVSTKKQEDKNSLEAQDIILKQHGATKIYKDVMTGIKNDRPSLQILLNELKENDILIVTKLDRIARSISQGNELINSLLERNITVNILNLGVLDNSPSSKLIRNIFFSFAEFERDLIIERTKEGKEIARTKAGFKDGRPKKFTDEQLNHALNLLETNSYKEVEKMTKISKSTLIRAKKNLS